MNTKPKPGARPPNKATAKVVARVLPARVRIIGGQWKRTPLQVIDAEGLRPTPDRVRETLFNWIGPKINGWHCLDLFAGTGALGLEAASRGAASVTLVEVERRAVAAIQTTVDKLKATQVTLWALGAPTALNRFAPASLDLVFLDPPFTQDWVGKLLPQLVTALKVGGHLYVESEKPWPNIADTVPNLAARFEVLKADRAGQVYYHLLRLQPDLSLIAEPSL